MRLRQWAPATVVIHQGLIPVFVQWNERSREGERRVGGVRLENMLVVTKTGAEIMDYFPREEILIAPR